MKGVTKLPVVEGRRELGFEVARAVVDGTTLSPTLAIVLDNDADFVVKRIWACTDGYPAGAPTAGRTVRPPTNLAAFQMRDGATGQAFFRQALPFDVFGSVPWVLVPSNSLGVNAPARAIANIKGLPSPYLLRRGSSLFIEVANTTGFTWVGDLWVALEGFRVYPGEKDPIPGEVKGWTLPYAWGGQFDASGMALGASAITYLGTMETQGKGQGGFILKSAAFQASGTPACAIGSGVSLDPSGFFYAQVRDSRQQGKPWIRLPVNAPGGQEMMPASFLAGGGLSVPWVTPRFLGGTDKLNIDLYTRPIWWGAAAPGDATPGTVTFNAESAYVPM